MLSIIGILVYYISNLVKNKNSKLPREPKGIPFFGNLLGMVKDPHLKLSKWANQYGKLYTIQMANRKTLVINDVKMLKELLGITAATGKFKTDTVLLISQGPHGILNTEGNVWIEQRQFCMKGLKVMGCFQSGVMDAVILNEVHEVCAWIREKLKTSEIVHVDHVLKHATINALWTLVTGERFNLCDSEVAKLLNTWMATTQRTIKTGLGFFPWLKYFAPQFSGFTAYDKACKEIHTFIEGKFLQYKSTYVEGRRRNLIDVYIEHMNKLNGDAEGKQSSFFGNPGWINSMSSVVELFVAGGEAPAIVLSWATIYLSHYPNVQKKMQTEIDQVIGRERDPSIMDRLKMPYTEAVILETLRLSSIAPLGIPHEILEDVSFHGYTLPTGLILMPNIYHIHHDPEVWGDAENFRPERFLGNDGDSLKRCVVAFQPGKRECLGEPLANDEIFLFVTKLFQQFCFCPNPDIPKEKYFKVDVGLALLPTVSGLIIRPRKY